METLLKDLSEFTRLWWLYILRAARTLFWRFETVKTLFAELLYRQRGKFVRPFVHSGMGALTAVGIMLAPIISEELPGTNDPWREPLSSSVLSAETEATGTLVSDKYRAEIIGYAVQSGDTIASLAVKFNVSQDTIIWQNKLTKKSILKPGQVLQILPVTGVSHKVEKGETVYSIAKKYSAEAQPIVDFPFNTFVNDETFALAVGQTLIIPDGAPPKEAPAPSAFARLTPDAGSITASGIFIWPAGGRISQGFVWYHKGIDIANKDVPDILAADSGRVIVAGWPDNVGYGNRVIIDHGNSYETLYGHLSQIYVVPGQTVARGDRIGKMGSTGRSTGTHLHVEIRQNGVALNPLDFLR
ncbi:MAG: M23 family metallopeptidase [Candidatus Blackburnbacteria bacterium]|nr:M23 family metallopeptidase [Candidatus Blackburnbacteria bacterium]